MWNIYARESSEDLYPCQMSSILSSAQLNQSQWNIAKSLLLRKIVCCLSWRSEHDLNDLSYTGCWITKLFEQPLESMPHVIFWLCGQELISPSPLHSQNLTPEAVHSGEAWAGRGIQPNSTATQRCNLSSPFHWTHLMKTNELSPLFLQRGSTQHC